MTQDRGPCGLHLPPFSWCQLVTHVNTDARCCVNKKNSVNPVIVLSACMHWGVRFGWLRAGPWFTTSDSGPVPANPPCYICIDSCRAVTLNLVSVMDETYDAAVQAWRRSRVHR
jgi:hypothetical protein